MRPRRREIPKLTGGGSRPPRTRSGGAEDPWSRRRPMKEITATPSTRRRRPEAVCHVCRSRRLRPSVAKCVSREADRVDGVGAEQRPLGFWGNDRGRRASPGPLSGQRKPRPRLSPWVGTASSCTKLPGHVLAPVKPLGRARADAFAPCGTPSDLVDGRGELYERFGRRTRHAASKRCLCPHGERARVEFVQSRGRRERATAALVGVAIR